MTRTCSRCGQERHLDEFPRASRPKASNAGFEGVCKPCVAAAQEGRTKRCRQCQEWKPLDGYRLTRQGNRANYCIDCRNAHQRARNAGEFTPNGDARKKLPDYETLKSLVLDRGMSYQQIADKYGVAGGRKKVQFTVRQRAQRRGEWPLLTPEQVEARRSAGRRAGIEIGTSRIKAGVIRELLEEYLDEHQMRQKDFAALAGLRPDYVFKLLHKPTGGAMPPAYAMRVLETLGEPIPVGLRERAKSGPQPGPLPSAVKQSDVAACAPEPVAADAEEYVA